MNRRMVSVGAVGDDIRKKTFHRSYLLYGPEHYLRNGYKHALVSALLPEGDTMNFSRYEGEDISAHDIISQAETLPFFADRRVILLEDTGIFAKSAGELTDYMKNLPDYLVMIFSEEKVDKRSGMYKAVRKDGVVEEYGTQPADWLMRWIGARIGKEKKKIRRPVMERLMQITGTDMTNIDSELEKLLSYVMSPDRPTAGEDPDEITLADLEEILAPQLEDQIFDMIRAVASHHQKQALDYYYELLALREAPLKIMALLTREYLQLYHVSELAAEGRPQNVIATAAGIPPFVVRRSLEVSRLYKRGEIRAILDDFAATEEDVKQGKISDRLAVEMLIIRYSSAAQRR
ncbi:MAG: DNA polymerase III subunit delta [Eubacteriales bacterium]